MQEGDDLSTGAGCIRGELPVARAAGYAVLYRPRYGLRILHIGGNIGKAGVFGGFRTACRFPQVGYSHGAGAGRRRAKNHAGDKTLLVGPDRRFLEAGGDGIRKEGLSIVGSGEPLALQRKIRICPLVHFSPEAKVFAVFPVVMFFSTAQLIASTKGEEAETSVNFVGDAGVEGWTGAAETSATKEI